MGENGCVWGVGLLFVCLIPWPQYLHYASLIQESSKPHRSLHVPKTQYDIPKCMCMCVVEVIVMSSYVPCSRAWFFTFSAQGFELVWPFGYLLPSRLPACGSTTTERRWKHGIKSQWVWYITWAFVCKEKRIVIGWQYKSMPYLCWICSINRASGEYKMYLLSDLGPKTSSWQGHLPFPTCITALDTLTHTHTQHQQDSNSLIIKPERVFQILRPYYDLIFTLSLLTAQEQLISFWAMFFRYIHEKWFTLASPIL